MISDSAIEIRTPPITAMARGCSICEPAPSANASGNVAPIRSIKGSHTQLSYPHGVFVDTKNDEVVVANFGNHSATVFPRGAAGDVAPLRMIRSGPLNEASLGIGNPHPVGYDSKRDQILVPN